MEGRYHLNRPLFTPCINKAAKSAKYIVIFLQITDDENHIPIAGLVIILK